MDDSLYDGIGQQWLAFVNENFKALAFSVLTACFPGIFSSLENLPIDDQHFCLLLQEVDECKTPRIRGGPISTPLSLRVREGQSKFHFVAFTTSTCNSCYAEIVPFLSN